MNSKSQFIKKKFLAIVWHSIVLVFLIFCTSGATAQKFRRNQQKRTASTETGDTSSANFRESKKDKDNKFNSESFSKFNKHWQVAYKKYKKSNLSHGTLKKVKSCVDLLDKKTIENLSEQQIIEVCKAYKLLFTIYTDLDRDDDKKAYTNKLYNLFDAKDETSQKKLMQKVNMVEL